jgi:hypothetical protein
MNSDLLARIGLFRLRLPIPTVKLAVVHAAAEVLRNDELREMAWGELLHWISELELESEVVEALCIPFLASDSGTFDANELRQAITRPSVLSDVFTAQIYKDRWKLPAWETAHSGIAPSLFSCESIVEVLTDGIVVPRHLGTRFTHLQDESKYPFMRQWAYEFRCLEERYSSRRTMSMDHFITGYARRDCGVFNNARSHMARSAYLRTLSLAFDRWEMPIDRVKKEAMHATPSDMTFLRVLPADPPSWIWTLLDCQPVLEGEWESYVARLVETGSGRDIETNLLYVNTCLTSSSTYMAQLELVTCLERGDGATSEEALCLHHMWPGHVNLGRDVNWDIRIGKCDFSEGVACDAGGSLYPALLPCLGEYVGYFQSDLIGRMPCLPANYSDGTVLLGRPRRGGLDILFEERIVGELAYWNWQWKPSYDKALGPQCGVCTSIAKGADLLLPLKV